MDDRTQLVLGIGVICLVFVLSVGFLCKNKPTFDTLPERVYELNQQAEDLNEVLGDFARGVEGIRNGKSN